MKTFTFLLLLILSHTLSAQEINIYSTAYVTYPGIEDGTTVKRYTFKINTSKKSEIQDVFFQYDHIYSREKLLLKKGENILKITYWSNRSQGTNNIKIILNGIDITENCFLEPHDDFYPNALFILKKDLKIQLEKFDESKTVAMP